MINLFNFQIGTVSDKSLSTRQLKFGVSRADSAFLGFSSVRIWTKIVQSENGSNYSFDPLLKGSNVRFWFRFEVKLTKIASETQIQRVMLKFLKQIIFLAKH